MTWGKSRHEQGRAADPISVDSSRLADRVLLTLIAQTEQINARLTLLEDRFDASMRASTNTGKANLDELRAHTERLATELSAVSATLSEPVAEDERVIDDRAPIDLTEPTMVETPDFDETVRLAKKPGWQPRP